MDMSVNRIFTCVRYIFLAVVVAVNLSIPKAYSQSDQCSEEKLRNLGVTMINCTGDTMSAPCGGGSLVGNSNAEKAYNFFAGKPGYEPFHAAGIVGNMMLESGVLPQRLQNTGVDVLTPAAEAVNSSLGWGIVQWTPGSKMINPTLADNKDPNDLSIQLEFVWNQLEGNPPLSEKAAGDQLKATTSIEDAVLAFQGNRRVGGIYTGYERPADQSGSVAERTNYARDVLAQFGSGTSVTGNASGCQLDASGCPTDTISQADTVLAAGIRVHPCISAEVERIVALASTQGIELTGGGYRDSVGQIETRKNNCGTSDYDIYDKPASSCNPPTAQPGESTHEGGTGIDFVCNGAPIDSQSDPCFVFLLENTALKNLKSEPWHWSVDGS